jgi:hypothetical protein
VSGCFWGYSCGGGGSGSSSLQPAKGRAMIAIAIIAIAISPKSCFLVFILNTPLILMLSFGQIYPLEKCVGEKDVILKSFFY